MKDERISLILSFIKRENEVSIAQITNHLSRVLGKKISKITVNRDLNSLLRTNKIEKIGISVATRYKAMLDIDEYFSVRAHDRVLKSETYNLNIWNELGSIFTARELVDIENVNKEYQSNREKLSPAILRKEIERLTIELSWKSSEIEGNTYSLLDTERLIKEKKEAEGKKREEAVMILNHKSALDFVFANPSYFKALSIQKIEELHHMLVIGLDVNTGVRKNRVGITGTKYHPLKTEFQIRDELFNLVDAVNKCENPFEKAFIAVIMISYIQPFEDGNKRTARILANALLLANRYCPLSYRSVDETEYKKAMILFYEQNNYTYFKELFVQQFKEAVDVYF